MYCKVIYMKDLPRARVFYAGAWHPKRKWKSSGGGEEPMSEKFPYKFPISFNENYSLNKLDSSSGD